ncbi:MAG: hypothetical protein KAI70_00770 [Candidatus Omnitrophica bacterium]|nr:hypothetical protein [Candidatus Omnitrophota bacterium]
MYSKIPIDMVRPLPRKINKITIIVKKIAVEQYWGGALKALFLVIAMIMIMIILEA